MTSWCFKHEGLADVTEASLMRRISPIQQPGVPLGTVIASGTLRCGHRTTFVTTERQLREAHGG